MTNECTIAEGRGRRSYPVSRGWEVNPPRSFEGMSEILSDFFSGYNQYSLWPFSEMDVISPFTPQVEIAEDNYNIMVNADLPGLDAKDIEISMTGDTLTIKGIKRWELEEKEEEIHCTERSYGSFARVLHIPKHVDQERVVANYSNGVLNITMPKLESGKGASRRIQVRSH
ncbi:MAG TPA: Hsp20/alpha crystallin family protein [Desulfomonilia bacterium]|nr:Hsp20/alpha crystallin family protein [Desulfomonilia bacterium]